MAKREKIQCQFYCWRIYLRPENGVWYADGRAIDKTLNRISLDTKEKEQALQNLVELDQITAMDMGVIPKTMAVDENPKLLIADGIDLYLDWVVRPNLSGGAKPQTRQRYKAVLDKFSKFAVEQRIIYWQQVSTMTLVAYNKWLDDQEASYRTQYLELTTLKQLIKVLNNQGFGGLQEIDLPLRKPSGTTRYCYTTEEVNAMIRFCMANPRLHWLARILITLAHTGMRISELADLRWTDIKGDVIILRDKSRQGTKQQRENARTTKGKRSREIPLHPRVAQVLDKIGRKDSGRIFHGPRGGKVKPDTVLDIFKCKVRNPLKDQFPKVDDDDELGFEDGVIHSFRHHFVSRCADLGIDEHKLKTWLGHQDSAMIRHYYHPDRETAVQMMRELTFIADDIETA